MSNILSVENLSRSLKKLPKFLRASHLIKLGIYSGRSDVTVAKRNGQGPPYIKISSHKVLFPRDALIAWLLEKTANQKESENDSDK